VQQNKKRFVDVKRRSRRKKKLNDKKGSERREMSWFNEYERNLAIMRRSLSLRHKKQMQRSRGSGCETLKSNTVCTD
jgi:hypothetical protein